MLAVLQMKVLKENSKLNSEVRRWENDHLFRTGKAPQWKDYEREGMMKSYEKHLLSTKLLKSWKIRF